MSAQCQLTEHSIRAVAIRVTVSVEFLHY